jgi:spermidine synthase
MAWSDLPLKAIRLSNTKSSASLLPLFVLSATSLYLEVMLIRWVGTEFRLFAYFQNLALIACFLGFGYGCLKPVPRDGRLFDVGALCALVIVIEFPWNGWKHLLDVIGASLSVSNDISVWHEMTAGGDAGVWQIWLVSVGIVGGVLMFLVAIMIPLGSWVAWYLEHVPKTVVGYAVNLGGSLAGILLFTALSTLRTSPVVWFLAAFVFAALLQPFWKSTGWSTAVAAAVCTAILAIGGFPEGKVVWSPYQKLELIRGERNNFQIQVNNTGYMTIADLSKPALGGNPALASSYRESSYETPYRFVTRLDDILIVGSGAGNDIAAALRHGAQRIDAVEIDPAIRDLGRAFHPEKPYDSPRVRVTIDDARDFMHHTSRRYDLILFALLDSHTQASSLTSMRIDNYVYTSQSFEEARRLLKPDGIVVVKFEVRPAFDWLGRRFFAQLNTVFGRPPVIYYNPQIEALLPATVYLESNGSELWQRAGTPEFASFLANHPPRFELNVPSPVPLTTDDWPYIYQRNRGIPRIYGVISIILMGLAVLLVRGRFQYRKRGAWHFFLLGAGFLLLETQMISRLALYFGSTWIVNCVALTFVLAVLVAASLLLPKFESWKTGVCFAVLAAALLGIYFIPWPSIPLSIRAIGLLLACAYSVPLFFAGVVFTRSFRGEHGSGNLLGANIIGAVAGGLAQNLSFVFGMKALLLVAIVFYMGAACFGAKEGFAKNPISALP